MWQWTASVGGSREECRVLLRKGEVPESTLNPLSSEQENSRQTWSEFGLGFQVRVLKIIQIIPSSLGSGPEASPALNGAALRGKGGGVLFD